MEDEIAYPELERMRKASEKSHIIGEFIEWLHDVKNIHFYRFHEHKDGCRQPHDHSQWSKCRRRRPMTGELVEFSMTTTDEEREKACVIGPDQLDVVCGYPEDPTSSRFGLETVNTSIEQLLADFFDIDLKKVDKERRALLDDIRKEAGEKGVEV